MRGFTAPTGKITCNPFSCVLQGVRDALEAGNLTSDKLDSVMTLSLKNLKYPRLDMFLDVATVLHGVNKDQALAAWMGLDKCACQCFRELEDRCLLRVGERGKLWMHDVIRALGRHMITARDNKYYGTRRWVEGDTLVPDAGSAMLCCAALLSHQACILFV